MKRDDLDTKVVNLGKRVAKRNAAKIAELPIWPEQQRGIPSMVLRSALFAAVQGKNRVYLSRVVIACQKGWEIRFSGMQLNQSDLDVWEQALHLAREHPLGTQCEFPIYTFLKNMGRGTGKSDKEWLINVFARLIGCGVELTDNDLQVTYGGSLLEFYYDKKAERYLIKFNPQILAVYERGWTAINWQQRQQLRGKPLALWLHGYYSSHAKPYPVKISTLQALSGSKTATLRKFKQLLKTAFDELMTIGFLNSYQFQDELVVVDKTLSPSQQRFLAKKEAD